MRVVEGLGLGLALGLRVRIRVSLVVREMGACALWKKKKEKAAYYPF